MTLSIGFPSTDAGPGLSREKAGGIQPHLLRRYRERCLPHLQDQLEGAALVAAWGGGCMVERPMKKCMGGNGR